MILTVGLYGSQLTYSAPWLWSLEFVFLWQNSKSKISRNINRHRYIHCIHPYLSLPYFLLSNILSLTNLNNELAPIPYTSRKFLPTGAQIRVLPHLIRHCHLARCPYHMLYIQYVTSYGFYFTISSYSPSFPDP